MNTNSELFTRQTWEIDDIFITHNIGSYQSLVKHVYKNDDELVRMHFGLSGKYDFKYKQLDADFSFTGHHNNIMYSDGFEIEIRPKSLQIETFGINFSVDTFVNVARNGTDTLRRFCDNVVNKKSTILSRHWRPNNFKIQSVINEIVNCTYSDELKNLFLLSKSIELLVLQAELYERDMTNSIIKSNGDKHKLFEAKEILKTNMSSPPTIVELSKMINLNEFKLKRGFKELFGTTVFGYIHNSRIQLAKRLLLDTSKSAKEIAYQTGYSSPQHFSTAFKKEFGLSPNSIRKNPNSVIM